MKDMSSMLYMQAMGRAVQEEMAVDESIVYLGEDVGAFGGTFFKNGLWPKYGSERVIEMPIAENLIVGSAVGMAAAGLRPICELMYADFLALAFDPLCNEAAKLRFQSAGKASVPMTLVTFSGTIDGSGSVHSQCIESWIANIPGVKIVMPSIASDAYGLMKTAIRDNDPVIYITHKGCMFVGGEVPNEEYSIPLGEARIAREGKDLTVVAWHRCQLLAMDVANELKEEKGYEIEVIDPRTLVPLDKDTIIKSVQKTGKLLVAHDAPTKYGAGGEIVSTVTDNIFDELKAAPVRLGAPSIPIPFNKLEEAVVVQRDDLKQAMIDLIEK